MISSIFQITFFKLDISKIRYCKENKQGFWTYPVAIDWAIVPWMLIRPARTLTDSRAASFRREYSVENCRRLSPVLYSPNVVLYARVEYLSTDKVYKREAFVYFVHYCFFFKSVITFKDYFPSNLSVSNTSSPHGTYIRW